MKRYAVPGVGLCLHLISFCDPAAAQTTSEQSSIRTIHDRANQNATMPATPVASSYPEIAGGDGAPTSGYHAQRWVEDWRQMKDPAKRDDPLDRLKYLPLNAAGEVYVTLSGELRLRSNYFSNPQGAKTEAQRQDSYRLMFGADLHVGKHLRAYGELARGIMGGPNATMLSGTLRNALFLQQAFVEGTTDVGPVEVGARYGRQVFIDGANLLVANRDNNTLYTSLNGVRGWVKGEQARIDAFDLFYTTVGNGGLGDDHVDKGRRFSGVTLGYVIPGQFLGGSKLFFDPFVWRLRDSAKEWGAETAREERIYVGAHLWGDVGPVTLDWTVNHQGGSYGSRDLDAWQILLAQNIKLGKSGQAPRIGFHFDYTTGGGANGKMRNAFSPHGNNIYYSYQGYLTPTNLVALAPNFTLSPFKKLRLALEYQFTWRQNTSDAVYRSNGSPFTGTPGNGGRYIGEVARLQAAWSLSPRVSVTTRLEHVFAGPALTNSGYRDSSYAAVWASLRF